jgi:hypothetical protein
MDGFTKVLYLRGSFHPRNAGLLVTAALKRFRPPLPQDELETNKLLYT